MAPTSLAVYSDECDHPPSTAEKKNKIGNSNQMLSNKTPLRSQRKASGRDDMSTIEKMDQSLKSLHKRLHDSDEKEQTQQGLVTTDKENSVNASVSRRRSVVASAAATMQASSSTPHRSATTQTSLSIMSAPPQTPFSLLKLEMNHFASDDSGGDHDESLLFSPAPLPPVLAAATAPPKQQQLRIHLKATRLKSPPERIPVLNTTQEYAHGQRFLVATTEKEGIHQQQEKFMIRNKELEKSSSTIAIAESLEKSEPKGTLPRTQNAAASMGISRAPLAARTNETKSAKPTRKSKEENEAFSVQNSKDSAQSKVEVEPLQPVRLKDVEQNRLINAPVAAVQHLKIVDRTGHRPKLHHPAAAHRPSTISTASEPSSVVAQPKQLSSVESPLVRLPITAACPSTVTTSVKHWSPAKPSFSIIQPARPTAATPFTTRGNGVCMDLSDIFFDAAKKTVLKPPRSAAVPKTIRNVVVEKSFVEEISNNSGDDSWADKQVQTFTKWLNYLFYPTEDKGIASSAEEETCRVALRSLVLHQRMAQGRLAAAVVYKDQDMANVRKIISAEISRNRIALRTDRDLYANLNHRNKITTLLLSYSTPWLRLGLETVFGTVIQPETPTQFSPRASHRGGNVPTHKVPMSRLKLELRNFIVHHVLSDDKILAKYTGGRCKVPSGSFEERYRSELRTIVLYRLLVLFVFLDRAKTANVLEKAPNLFTRDSTVKSTRDVLLAFCRDFLKAEGDFVKHLSRVGLQVFYKQDSVDELDFTVTNLRVDLNDGVRLARMTELLTGASLLQELRLPAVSRLQKFHNVGIALDRLAAYGVPLTVVAPHHIVDGHREMVLKLLWSVVGHCCLLELLTVEQVQAEIGRIQRLHGLSQSASQEEDKPDLENVILQWCDVVCTRFGRCAKDLTSSFADGKLVCLLIHYYHPTLLRLDEIYQTSNDTLAKYSSFETLLSNERANGILVNACMSDLGGIPEMMPICDTKNPPEEKSMLLCLTFLCSRLMETGVEIRACIIIQNCYRDHRKRILRILKDTAAVKILVAWRLNKINFYQAQQRLYGAAVRTIEQFIAENRSALQLVRLRRLDWEKMNRAIIVIQKHVRSFCAKHRVAFLVERERSVIALQCIWRQELAHRRFVNLAQRRRAVILIQTIWRHAQLHDSFKNAAATQIQRLFRGYSSRFQFVIDVLDIIAVQSCARRWLANRLCYRFSAAAITLQCAGRCFLARTRLEAARLSALRMIASIRLQTVVRQCLAKGILASKREQAASSILIQSLWRRRQARAWFVEMIVCENERIASRAIQSTWRRWQAQLLLDRMKRIEKERRAVTSIQSVWRMFDAQTLLDRMKVAFARKVAAVSIQSSFRMHQAEVLLDKLKLHASLVCAAVSVQSVWRGLKVRSRLIKAHLSATRIQSVTRSITPRLRFVVMRKSAILIQACWKKAFTVMKFQACIYDIRLIQTSARKFLAKKECSRRRNALLRLQCVMRQSLARRQRRELKRTFFIRDAASVTVQRCWRGFSTFVKFQLVLQDVVLIQRTYRRFLAVMAADNIKRAVQRLQQAARRTLARNRLRTLVAQKIAMESAKLNAAVRIQAAFRSWLVRHVFGQLNRCALTIQRIFRGHVARIDCFLETNDIIMVQSTVRRWLAKQFALRRYDAIWSLQCAVRCFLARLELASLFAAKQQAALERHAATTVQRVLRGLLGRRLAERQSSARKIQKTWRCYTVHVEYMLSILAAIDIQASARRYIGLAAYKRQYAAIVCIQSFAYLAIDRIRALREERCAIILQSIARMHSSRKSFLLRQAEEKSAIVLQSAVRMLVVRSSLLLKKDAATVLQRFARGFVARLQLETENFAASEIQRIWRGFVASEYLAWNILAAIKVQSCLRRLVAQRLANQCRLERLAEQRFRVRSAIKIQRAYLGYVVRMKIYCAACVCQHAARQFLSRITFGKVRRGVLRAQSLIRGQIARRQRSKKLVAQVVRIERANANARASPKMKLGNRTKAALDILLKSKSLTEIMDAVCILEIATRLSEVCCTSFAEAGAPDILFCLIRTCNRSLPHVKLLHGVLLTMSNVALFDYLLPSMATVTGVEVFLDLVQMFRDKDFVFCLVVSLLERVVRSSEEVMALCTSKENLKRLKGVRDLCVRKLSVAGPDFASQRRGSLEVSLHLALGRQSMGRSKNLMRQDKAPDVRQGVRRLQRIIRLVECDRHENE